MRAKDLHDAGDHDWLSSHSQDCTTCGSTGRIGIRHEDPATRAGSPILITPDLTQILLPYTNLRTGPEATDAPMPLAIKG